MSIDITKDELLSLGQLARRLPKIRGVAVNVSTCWRWMRDGIRGHKLEVVYLGGRTFTTWQAYLDLAAAIAGGKGPAPTQPTKRTRRRIRDAGAVLKRAGIRPQPAGV